MVAARWAAPVSAAALLLALAGCSRAGADEGGPAHPAPAASTTTQAGGLPTDGSLVDPSESATATGGGTGGPTSSTAPTTAPIDRVVLAAGVRQHLRCTGTGATTVVVVPGLAVTTAEWTDLTEPVEAVTRTCVYERPGIGRSPARTSPNQVVDAGVNAQELATLLAVAHQPGPYVLVGQGYGTLVARAFARQHPALVRALLLGGDAPAVDGSQLFWTEAGHRIDVASSTTAAGPTPVSSPNLTVTTEPDDDAATLVADLSGLLDTLAG